MVYLVWAELYLLTMRPADGESHQAFGMDDGFLFPGVGSYARSGSATSQGPNSCAFATASQSANYSTGRSATADFGDVALGVALAFAVVRTARNRLSVDGR